MPGVCRTLRPRLIWPLDWFRRKSIAVSEARLCGEVLNVWITDSSTLHLSHNERHASLLLTDSQTLLSALEALELLSLTAAAGDNDGENHTMM